MRLSVWPKEAALSISSDSKACQLDLLQLENAAMRRLAVAGLSALAMLLVAASNASASAITIAGTTAGCFGAVGSCGGSIGGFNADDCDDVYPLFRDDVIDAVSTCFDKTCDAVLACVSSVAKSKESAACSGI